MMTKTPTKDDAAQADEDSSQAATVAENPIVIRAQYVKDLSFEAPLTPGVLIEMQKNPPEISINIDVNAAQEQDSSFEVTLQIKAKCMVEKKVGFIMELVYGGLFSVNVPPEHLQTMLLIECPRLLFPFARNILADTTRDGGFPPLMLDPVDFVTMFRNQMEAQQNEDGETEKTPPTVN